MTRESGRWRMPLRKHASTSGGFWTSQPSVRRRCIGCARCRVISKRSSGAGSAPPWGAVEQWSARHEDLEKRLAAELRWTPKLTELRFWIEEYRVSLYAQELKTLGPVSAARLSARAAEIDAWLSR